MKCDICGCTEADCSACVRLTGFPCSWAKPNRCTTCAALIRQHAVERKRDSNAKAHTCDVLYVMGFRAAQTGKPRISHCRGRCWGKGHSIVWMRGFDEYTRLRAKLAPRVRPGAR